jgi:hypothetical protein
LQGSGDQDVEPATQLEADDREDPDEPQRAADRQAEQRSATARDGDFPRQRLGGCLSLRLLHSGAGGIRGLRRALAGLSLGFLNPGGGGIRGLRRALAGLSLGFLHSSACGLRGLRHAIRGLGRAPRGFNRRVVA